MNHGMIAGVVTSVCAYAAVAQAQPEAGGVNVVGMPTSQQAGSPAGTASGGTPLPAGGAQQQSPFSLLLPMILVMAVVLILPMIAGRKEKKKRAEMMASLKRGDRVMTTGGIIGTIIDLSDEDVVLRMEEGRIRFSRNAIHQVLTATRVKSEATITEPKPADAATAKA